MESSNPKNEIDWMGSVINGELTVRFEYDVLERAVYMGETLPGQYNEVSSNVWRIKKFLYSGSMTSPIAIIWANGTNAKTNAWESASLYDYR